jgi:hypothetical protein
LRVTKMVAYIQGNKVSATSTNGVSCSFGSNTGANHALVVAGRVAATAPTPACTDTQSNTFAHAAGIYNANGATTFQTDVFVSATSSAAADTITYTSNVFGTIDVAIHEYSGLATTLAEILDLCGPANAIDPGSGSTSPSSGAVTPTNPSCLLFGAFGISAGTPTFTAGNMGTNGTATVRENVSSLLVTEDIFVPAAGLYQANGTLSASENWSALLVSLVAAPTGYLSPIGVEAQFFTNAGAVLAGGKIATYLAGTSTATATYTDPTLGTANANPIILSAAGRLPSGVWQVAGIPIRAVISDSSNNVLMTIDNIVGIGDPVGAGPKSFVPPAYPITATEIAASIPPTNYSYPPGHVLRYGATGNGSTDDSTAISRAAIGGNGVFIAPAATYYMGSTIPIITFNYVNMVLQGKVLFTGTGYMRGVLTNENIPHAAFQVGYNFVTAKERAPVAITASYWVDPLLGNDITNNGTSAATPVASITKALSLIAGVAGSASALTIVLRSGRHEQPLGGTTSGFVSLTSGGTITWTCNPGEQPVFTPTLFWFFNSSAKTLNYNGVYATANTIPASAGGPYAFVDLWDAETGLPVECANNMGPNYSLPRNQTANVSIAGTVSPWTISMQLTGDDIAAFNTMTSTEQAGCQLRLNQDYTTSWHDHLSLSGSVLSGHGYVGPPSGSAYYYNGWATVGLTLGAPYLLRNIKGCLNGRNFCGYSDNVYLPNRGTNYFTTDQTCTSLISLGSAANHTFQGIAFRYQSAQMSSIAQAWPPAPFPQMGYFGLVVGGSGANQIVQNCTFEYGCYNGFILGYTNSQAIRNKVSFIGLTGISFNNSQGSSGALVKWNTIRRCGYPTSAAGRAIHGGGFSVTVANNDVRNCCTDSVEIDALPGPPPGGNSGEIINNVVLDCGIVDGAPSMMQSMNDAGALHPFGSGLSTPFNLNIIGNVIGRVSSPNAGYGIYIDGGQNGVNVWGNLVWGIPIHALIIAQDAGHVYNNSIRNNLFLGSVRMDSAAPSFAISSIAWSAGVALVTTAASIPGLNAGDIFSTTIAGVTPAGYNGNYDATVTGANTFTFPLAVNPGVETVPGTYALNSDLSNNVIASVRDNQIATSNITAINPNQYGCLATGNADFVELSEIDPAYNLLANNALGTGWSIDPFVLNFIRRFPITPESPNWSTASLVITDLTLSDVIITGTAGQFACAPTNLLIVGLQITISGTFGGTGSITGYTNPTTYLISATNGSTTFTLTLSGVAIVTTVGTPTGLTYKLNAYTVADTDESIIFNSSSTTLIRFPSGPGGAGRELLIKTVGSNVNSNSPNVAPLTSNTFGTVILPAIPAGSWARLKADGLGNWYIMASGP